MKPAIFGGNTPPLPAGVSVRVYKAGTASLATVYDFDTGAAIDQTGLPLVADASGRFSFTADPGQMVDVKIGGEGSAADLTFNGGAARWFKNYPMVDPSPAQSNILINGNFDVWQRGTGTFSIPGSGGSAYTADRWLIINLTDQSVNVNTTGEVMYGARRVGRARIWFDTAPTTGKLYIVNKTEDVSTMSGEDTVMSFLFATQEANLLLRPYLYQSFGGGGSEGVATYDEDITHNEGTGAFVPYSMKLTPPSVAGKTFGTDHYVEWSMWLEPRSTNVMSIALAKWERGAVATPYPYEDKAETVSRCQRYYEIGGGSELFDIIGNYRGTTINFATKKRAIPTVAVSGATNATTSTIFVGPYGFQLSAFIPDLGQASNFSGWTADAEL